MHHSLIFGGEGEIRTLEPLLTVTRFPIVRARPATRLLRICSSFNVYLIATKVVYHKKFDLSIAF